MRPAAAVLCAALVLGACSRLERRFAFDPKDFHRLPPPRRALAETAYRVRWDAHSVPREVPAGDGLEVRLTLTNVSTHVWPDPLAGDPAKRDGGYAVRLAHQWLGAGDDADRRPPNRLDLPRPVAPGETIALLLGVDVPARPGEYRLVFELLQERVAWFEAKGATKLVVPVTVK